MAAYWLTWNPLKWQWAKLPKLAVETKAGGRPRVRWSSGNRRTMSKGSRVFLLRQTRDRGIIGSGFTDSRPFRDDHWDDPNKQANYVRVRWDTLLEISDRLPIEDLEAAKLRLSWGGIQCSGIEVPNDAIFQLEQIWMRHLARIGRAPERLPDELVDSDRYREGAVRTVTVDAFERSPVARQKCLDHYGTVCVICGFDFAEVYGDMGNGFTHVHHLRDLAQIGREYEVDAIADLRPVCANCHAMLHRRNPTLKIEQLRRIVERQRTRRRTRLVNRPLNATCATVDTNQGDTRHSASRLSARP